jgi:hypothetical protein
MRDRFRVDRVAILPSPGWAFPTVAWGAKGGGRAGVPAAGDRCRDDLRAAACPQDLLLVEAGEEAVIDAGRWLMRAEIVGWPRRNTPRRGPTCSRRPSNRSPTMKKSSPSRRHRCALAAVSRGDLRILDAVFNEAGLLAAELDLPPTPAELEEEAAIAEHVARLVGKE